MKTEFKTIDEYIKSFPSEVQEHLQKIRALAKKHIPEANETIKYQMPTFVLKGNILHFAAYKKHIGFYPTAEPIEAFKKDLEGLVTSKGAIQFSLDKPMPYELIEKLIIHRVEKHKEKLSNKK